MNLKPLLAAAALLMATAAHGAVLVSLPYDLNDPAGALSFASVSNPSVYRVGFEPFTLSSASTLTSLDVIGFVDPTWAPVSAFTVVIFADSAGLPGSVVGFGTLPGDGDPTQVYSPPEFGYTTYSYAFDLGHSDLAAGHYWLSVYASTDDGWFWGEDLTGPGLGQFNAGAGFSPTNVDYAFTLNGYGVVPEPAAWSMMLLGAGIAGAVLRRRFSAGAPIPRFAGTSPRGGRERT